VTTWPGYLHKADQDENHSLGPHAGGQDGHLLAGSGSPDPLFAKVNASSAVIGSLPKARLIKYSRSPD